MIPWGSQLMDFSKLKLNYLPLALPFFSMLATAFLALVALIEFGALRYTYV
jgi:hypothetical protein